MRKIFANLKLNLKKPYVLSWILLSFVMLFVFISVYFEYDHWVTYLFVMLLVPLMFGIKTLYKEEVNREAAYKVDVLDGLTAGIGVILTYVLAHELNFGPVLASSFVGLLGYLILKKYSVAMYCGSFAGMVSAYIFGYFEVLVIIILCGTFFTFLKHVFTGMGGKLGTIAFIATAITAIIFKKDTLIIVNDLNIIRLILISLSGVLISFYIQTKLKQSPVISSALPSFIFALVMIYIVKTHITCTIVFFSASFIGMSTKDRLPNIIYVIIAGLIHAVLFHIYFEFYHGLGGKLGLMALTTMTMTLGIRSIYQIIERKFRIKKANKPIEIK